MRQVVARRLDHHAHSERRTRAAWERFASGDDDVDEVPPLILLSWQRSRDVHRVDPLGTLPPRATGTGDPSLLQSSVVTRLGGIAAGLAGTTDGALTTVTDGSGHVLGSWGGSEVRRRAAQVNLAPLFCWSEATTGTNAVGTALGRARPVSVRGPEHWCASLHDWTCTGFAVTDVRTGRPVAVLTLSSWKRGCAPRLPGGVERELASITGLLREQAARDAAELVSVFTATDRAVGADVAVLVADVAGTVVAANARAHAVGAGLPPVPAPRHHRASPQYGRLAATARWQAAADPDWSGDFRIALDAGDPGPAELVVEVRPVRSGGEFAGIVLVGSDRADVEAPAPAPAPADGPTVRVAGICGGRLILLSPAEIRYAQADRHVVWLVSDRGRVRAADRGLDNLEARLRPFGFLRVHRGYLVNVHRIREVDPGIGRGSLTVRMQHHGGEPVPVARRHVPVLRSTLGI